MDYETALDPEMRAYLAHVRSFYPADATERSIAEQREVYDRMAEALHQGRPDGVEIEDARAETVPLRVYSAGDPAATVLYFHGGGFVVGGLESHDDICAEICATTGYRVVSADYRLAPEHPHPAAFEDAMIAATWVCETYSGPIVLAGDSAGGNLAAAVAHATRGREIAGRISGQMLIYPGLGGDRDRGSYLTHSEAPELTRADVIYYQDVRSDGPPPLHDPTFAPLADQDFADLPPTIVVTAECDPVNDDGRDYRDRIRAAGGRAEWIEEPGLVHGFLRARSMSTRARDSFERIVAGIQCLGQRVWPYASG